MTDFIPTKASMSKNKADQNFITVEDVHKIKKFENEERKVPSNKTKNTEQLTREEIKEKEEKEMKKMRFEVMKFGMSGLDKEQSRAAKLALAISLGAKPPKNKKRNYKVLLEIRKKEAEEKQKQEKTSSGFSGSLLHRTKSKNKKNKPKDSGLLGAFGKVQKKTGKR